MDRMITYKPEKIKSEKTNLWLTTVIDYMISSKTTDLFNNVNVKMKQVNYSIKQKLLTIIASIIIGCEYTKDINNELSSEKTVAGLMGMKRFPDQSQINILIRRFDSNNIKELKDIHIEILKQNSLSYSLEESVVIDVDQSGLIANGKTYELSKKGYFPKKKNQKGYKMSASYNGNTKEALSIYLEEGNSDEFNNMENILSDIKKIYSENETKNIIVRLDAGYGSKKGIDLLKKYKLKYITKMYSNNQVKRLKETVNDEDWLEISELVSVYELERNTNSRYILVKILTKKGYQYSCLITNIENKTAEEIFYFYNERQTIEAFFKTCKNTYSIKNLRTRKYHGIYSFLILVFITHNILINTKKIYFEGTKIESMGMKSIYSEFGYLMADVVKKDDNIEILIPKLNKLTEIIIDKLCNKNEQISIFMLNKCLLN